MSIPVARKQEDSFWSGRALVSAGSTRRGYDHSSARGVAISCRPIAALRRTISNLMDNAIK
jgi:hypothetical protein